MQMLVATLLAAGGLLLSAPVLSAAQPGAHAMSQIDCLIVPKASAGTDQQVAKALRTPSASQLDAANDGHEIQPGNFYVFALRKYDDDGSGVDAGYFSKTTLEIIADAKLDIAPGQTERFKVSRGYYSEGGVGFIHKGNYWRARDPISVISITRVATGLVARLQGTFVGSRASDGTPKNISSIDLVCPIRIVSIDDLSPWEGKPGTGWNSFAPER